MARPLRLPVSRAVTLASLGLLALAPTPAAAQGAGPTLAGAATGLIAGGVVSLGLVTARARAGSYVYTLGDDFVLTTLPVAVGTIGGAILGASDRGRLESAWIGSAVGLALGAGAGALIGRRKWEPPEGAWAGAVIGGASGLLAGAIVGLLAHDDESGTMAHPRAPIGFTIRLR